MPLDDLQLLLKSAHTVLEQNVRNSSYSFQQTSNSLIISIQIKIQIHRRKAHPHLAKMLVFLLEELESPQREEELDLLLPIILDTASCNILN
jgi:hypothetical protein